MAQAQVVRAAHLLGQAEARTGGRANRERQFAYGAIDELKARIDDLNSELVEHVPLMEAS